MFADQLFAGRRIDATSARNGQKVSLPDEWRDAYLKKLESENADVRHSSDLFVQNLKNDISAVSARLSRLTDAYLNEALELGDYLECKNALTAEKRTLEEKLSDFERKGNHWLELMRNWILEANQAGNLIKQENLSGMKDFLVDIGSNRRVAYGNAFGGIQNPLEFLGGNQCRGVKPRGNFFGKSNLVDPRGIEPLSPRMQTGYSTTKLRALHYSLLFHFPILLSV